VIRLEPEVHDLPRERCVRKHRFEPRGDSRPGVQLLSLFVETALRALGGL
jgi:hypothetical protein